ncbi:hypothetical protein PMAYCL1PPCAC_13786, partial [Pristionchus mayeri]
RLAHLTRSDMILDYSPEAIAGRIVLDVDQSATFDAIFSLLNPFGSILDFSLSSAISIKGRRAVFAKFQNNEVADAAVSALDRCKLGGNTVRAKRAEYLPRNREEIATKQSTVPYLSNDVSMSRNSLEEKAMTKEEKGKEEVKRTFATRAVTMTAIATLPLAAAARTLQQPVAARTISPTSLGVQQFPHATRPDRIIDFSAEAIEGCITIFDVPLHVTEEEIRTLLRPFGPIVELHHKARNSSNSCYAIVKLQGNDAANR